MGQGSKGWTLFPWGHAANGPGFPPREARTATSPRPAASCSSSVPPKAAGSRCQPPKAEGTGRAAAVGHQILLYAPEAELPAPLASPSGTSEHPQGCVPALELGEGDTRTPFSGCPSKSECQMTGGQTSRDPLPLPPSPPGHFQPQGLKDRAWSSRFLGTWSQSPRSTLQ